MTSCIRLDNYFKSLTFIFMHARFVKYFLCWCLGRTMYSCTACKEWPILDTKDLVSFKLIFRHLATILCFSCVLRATFKLKQAVTPPKVILIWWYMTEMPAESRAYKFGSHYRHWLCTDFEYVTHGIQNPKEILQIPHWHHILCFQNAIWMCVARNAVDADILIYNGGISIFRTACNVVFSKPLYEFGDNDSGSFVFNSFHRHYLCLILIDYEIYG